MASFARDLVDRERVRVERIVSERAAPARHSGRLSRTPRWRTELEAVPAVAAARGAPKSAADLAERAQLLGRERQVRLAVKRTG